MPERPAFAAMDGASKTPGSDATCVGSGAARIPQACELQSTSAAALLVRELGDAVGVALFGDGLVGDLFAQAAAAQA